MNAQTYDDKKFENQNFAGQVITGREFQSCAFVKCDLSNSDLSGSKFLDCVFEHCNLSMMKLVKTTLNDVTFKHCKILGVNFYECQDFLFSIGFDNCIADYSSFMRKKMVKTKVINSSCKEVNFTQTILSGSVFDGTDLSGAIFNGTDLSACHLAKAMFYSIDPELNNVRKATFAVDGLSGLLDKYGIKIV